mmetsp:Transcript_11567/g.15753  ORF Transcript_11567/g.15753 Transcript_11567/m.15753 type:complete len:241 (-) Transcript_11567:316-1038(-)
MFLRMVGFGRPSTVVNEMMTGPTVVSAMRLNRFGWYWVPEKSKDENYMDLAYLLARNSVAMDGHMGCCVLTKSQDIILDGINYGFYAQHRSEIHAEAGIISHAAKQGISLQGASLYVTRAPCPRCYLLIATCGISKIVAPNQMTQREIDTLERQDIEYIVLRDSEDRTKWRSALALQHRDQAAIDQDREIRKALKKQFKQQKGARKGELVQEKHCSALASSSNKKTNDIGTSEMPPVMEQ